jgi:hypothetical protein
MMATPDSHHRVAVTGLPVDSGDRTSGYYVYFNCGQNRGRTIIFL